MLDLDLKADTHYPCSRPVNTGVSAFSRVVSPVTPVKYAECDIKTTHKKTNSHLTDIFTRLI